MGQKRLIENYLRDLNNLAEYLTKLVSSYRLLIGGAAELNGIALASKSQVKRAIKRADELGEVIDELIDVFETTNINYINYCQLKSTCIRNKLEMAHIQEEIDEELKIE